MCLQVETRACLERKDLAEWSSWKSVVTMCELYNLDFTLCTHQNHSDKSAYRSNFLNKSNEQDEFNMQSAENSSFKITEFVLRNVRKAKVLKVAKSKAGILQSAGLGCK